jgi:hypothetical protein
LTTMKSRLTASISPISTSSPVCTVSSTKSIQAIFEGTDDDVFAIRKGPQHAIYYLKIFKPKMANSPLL